VIDPQLLATSVDFVISLLWQQRYGHLSFYISLLSWLEMIVERKRWTVSCHKGVCPFDILNIICSNSKTTCIHTQVIGQKLVFKAFPSLPCKMEGRGLK
jgi:hypothetical protein